MATNPGRTGLVSWWSLDEASGTRADSHGSNHLSPVATPGNATGKVGSGVDLESGSSQYLTIAAAAQTGLGSAGSFSFGAWYKKESGGVSGHFIASKRDAGAAEFTVTTDSTINSGCFFYTAPGFSPLTVTSVFSPATWVFVVVGYNSATGRSCVSVNGAAPTTAVRTYGGLASAPFSIGYDLSGGLPTWDGVIDEAFYYTRWLSDDELSWLYNSGAGRAYAETSSGSALPLFAAQIAVMS